MYIVIKKNYNSKNDKNELQPIRDCISNALEDYGGAFAMGAGGGTVWHAFKGSFSIYYNLNLLFQIRFTEAPKGDYGRTALQFVRLRAPQLGGIE
jgi:hypothetical protein